MHLAITIPTYNEAANIKELLPLIASNLKGYPDLRCTVFIVDDSSPDGTAAVAQKVGQKLKRSNFEITVLSRAKKEGLGKAYIFAFQTVLQKDFDYILQMDADLSHDPKYLTQFLDGTKQADFVVGSRYMRGGGTPDWSLKRKLLSQGANLYARLFFGSRITDYTGGYNLYSTDLLKKIDLEALQAGSYSFLIQLKYLALKNCHDTVQVPIVFMDRTQGNSKLPQGSVVKNLALVVRLRFGHDAS